jgi:hypothetical protein
VCPIVTPPLLFIRSGQLCENCMSTLGMDQEPTIRHHVATADWRLQGRFGRPLVGSNDGVLSRGGCQVVLKSIPGVHRVWRRFGHVCGPYSSSVLVLGKVELACHFGKMFTALICHVLAKK